MTQQYDRRDAIKRIGSALVGISLIPFGLAGCGGDESDQTNAPSSTGGASSGQNKSTNGGGAEKNGESTEQTHDTPHPDDIALSKQEKNGEALGGAQHAPGGKSPKDGPSVQYSHKPSGDKRCGNCNMYVPDQNEDGFGACTMVDGEIHPCDFCILFTQYTGDKSIPCGA